MIFASRLRTHVRWSTRKEVNVQNPVLESRLSLPIAVILFVASLLLGSSATLNARSFFGVTWLAMASSLIRSSLERLLRHFDDLDILLKHDIARLIVLSWYVTKGSLLLVSYFQRGSGHFNYHPDSNLGYFPRQSAGGFWCDNISNCLSVSGQRILGNLCCSFSSTKSEPVERNRKSRKIAGQIRKNRRGPNIQKETRQAF